MAIIGEYVDSYPGGYAVVDCAGWDRFNTTTQTVPGLYQQFRDAFDSGKMIITLNETQTITGETDHFISSPNILRVVDTVAGLVVAGNRLVAADDTVSALT